ncbi:MAG: MlaD family protein [Actinomycetota bacterium]|nr:MlaD family protein [Actinomycetota bacterium]
MKTPTEVKVGIFALLVLALLSLMTFWVGGFNWLRKPGYKVYVYFNNAGGLDKKSRIRVAGVEAGQIEDIRLEGDKARLTLRVSPKVTLYSDASASIKSMGLLGEKYLELKTGSVPPRLKDGDTIKNVQEVVDVDDMLRRLSSLSEGVNTLISRANQVLSPEQVKALQDSILSLRDLMRNANEALVVNDRKIRDTLDYANNMVRTMDHMVKYNQQNIDEIIANIKNISDTIRQNAPEIAGNLRQTSSDIKNLVASNGRQLTSIMNNTSMITNDLAGGKGTLGKLLTDDSLYNSASSTMKSLGTTLGAVNRFKLYLDFQGLYMTKLHDTKGRFLLTLAPNPNKYYIIGVTSTPVLRATTSSYLTTGTSTADITTTTIEKRILLTAQYARRFKNTAIRLGVTENTFGLGVDQFLKNDKLKLSLDAYDFSKNEAFANHPHITIGGDYKLFKYLYLSAGYDDILNQRYRGPYFGAGIRFEDEDLKYLLGSAPTKY